MKVEFDSVYKVSALIVCIASFVFGSGAWATQMYYIAEDNSKVAQQISVSVKEQSMLMKTLTSTISDHEVRLRVNENTINNIRESIQK